MRLSFRRRISAALALGAIAASGVAGAAPTGDDLIACRSKGQVSRAGKGWLKIKAFRPASADEGPREVVDFDASPATPNRIFATNGVVVKMSTDGGCTWNHRIAEGSSIMLPGGQHDTDVFTALTSPNDDKLWVVGYDDISGVPKPKVHSYANIAPGSVGDPEHTQPENGLPPVGKPVDLVSSTVEATTNFMLIEEPADANTRRAETTRKLYASYVPQTDPPEAGLVLGLTWKHVPTPPDLGSIEGMALGPGTRGVWVWSGGEARLTLNPEADNPTWIAPRKDGGQVYGIDTSRLGESLIASKGDQGVVGTLVSAEGKVISTDALPIQPVAMAHGVLRKDTRVLAGTKSVRAFDARLQRWLDITPKAGAPLRNLAMTMGAANPIVLGNTKDAIYRFDTHPGESFVPIVGKPMHIDTSLIHSKFLEPHFVPEYTEVTVQPGKFEDVAEEFRMPSAAHFLDVFFLVDTTGSMQPAIDALKADILEIARGIKRELGHQACFGVGDFKDFSPTQPTSTYRVHQKVAPCEVDADLPKTKAALEQLHADNGGADIPEAQTIALDQLVTGTGMTNPFVMPNQDAEFRPEAYKVVVLITDAPFKKGGNFPTMEKVVQQLSALEIKVVNVQVHTSGKMETEARADMTELGFGTNTLAPPSGIDCNGDGTLGPGDVPAGQPILCDWIENNLDMGNLVVTLLLGVEDPGTVDIGVSDPHHVVGKTRRGKLSAILNLKRDVKLPFTLPVTCSKAQDGLDLPVDLSATVRALPVDAQAQILVKCRSKPVLPRPPIRKPPPPIPPEPPAPPLPRLPLPAIVPPPLNPPAQPPANINLNAGFSQQEEQQFQLAAVTQGAGEEQQDQEEIELAMSALDQDTGLTPVAAFLAGAVVASSAAAVAYRRRLQRTTRPNYARVK